MIIVIGVGQLGSEIVRACNQRGIACKGMSSSEFNVLEFNEFPFRDSFCKNDESVTIINTAAYHDVDICEHEPTMAWAVNSKGCEQVAMLCEFWDAKYVFISTDYCNALPLDENNQPLSVYAKTKLAGELAALAINKNSLVVRVGTTYGIEGCHQKKGGNFIDTIVGKIKSGEKFSLPSYSSLIPTYAKHAAIRIINNLDKSGIWYANDEYGQCSHYEIGCTIASKLKLPNKIMSVSYDPTDLIRPKTIVYDRNKWLKMYNQGTYEYNLHKDPIEEYLIEKGHK